VAPYCSCRPRAIVFALLFLFNHVGNSWSPTALADLGPRFLVALLFNHIGNLWCPSTLVDLGPHPLYHYIAAWYYSCPIFWGSFCALPLLWIPKPCHYSFWHYDHPIKYLADVLAPCCLFVDFRVLVITCYLTTSVNHGSSHHFLHFRTCLAHVVLLAFIGVLLFESSRKFFWCPVPPMVFRVFIVT